MSVSASATFDERGSVALTYLDILLVLVIAVPALSLGAPALGYTVGGAAWILVRVASTIVERRIGGVGDVRRQLGFAVGYRMLRVWILACAIIVLGIAASRADGLTAALVIFGAFSVSFACSAIAHVTDTRRAGS